MNGEQGLSERYSGKPCYLSTLALALISLNHCCVNSRDHLVQFVEELVHTKPSGSFVQARVFFRDALQYVKAKTSEA